MNCGGGHNTEMCDIRLCECVNAVGCATTVRFVASRHESIFRLLNTTRSAYTLSFNIKFIFGNRKLQMLSATPLLRFSFHLSCRFHCTPLIRQAQWPLGLCTYKHYFRLCFSSIYRCHSWLTRSFPLKENFSLSDVRFCAALALQSGIIATPSTTSTTNAV